MTRLVCLLAILSVPALAATELYTYRFTGTISTITDNTAALTVDESQPFVGWFSFHHVPDQNTQPDVAYYNQNASISLILPAIGLSLADKPAGISMVHDTGHGRFDGFNFNVTGAWGGLLFTDFRIVLVDTTNSAFQGTDLPPNLDLSNHRFTTHEIQLKGYQVDNPAQTFDITGNLDTITLVPEPATLALLVLGALAIRRRRR